MLSAKIPDKISDCNYSKIYNMTALAGELTRQFNQSRRQKTIWPHNM